MTALAPFVVFFTIGQLKPDQGRHPAPRDEDAGSAEYSDVVGKKMLLPSSVGCSMTGFLFAVHL
jgi:hypothetical protein